MPSRKSDQRKNEATSARFALVDEVEEQERQQQQQEQEKAATEQPDQQPTQDAVTAVVVPQTEEARTEGTPTQTESSAQPPKSPSQEKKDKDKERDDRSHHADKDAVTIEDLTLPKSIITRLAKGVLPPNTQIQANAILALSKSTTVFINYLASHANEHTTNAGKKTILPADVFKALEDTEFDFFKDRLEAEFSKFNAIQTEKRTSYRQKVRAAKHPPSTTAHDPSASGPAGGDEGNHSTITSVSPDDDDVDMTDGMDTTMASITSKKSSTTLKSSKSSKITDRGPQSKKARLDKPLSKGTNDDPQDDDAEETEEEVPDAEVDSDDDDEEEEEDAEEEGDDEEDVGSGDETQDALDDREGMDDGDGREVDEALDGDDSD